MDVRAKRRCGRSVLPEADAKRDQLKIRLGAGDVCGWRRERGGAAEEKYYLRQPRKTDYSEFVCDSLAPYDTC
jgi:hypothetical protein